MPFFLIFKRGISGHPPFSVQKKFYKGDGSGIVGKPLAQIGVSLSEANGGGMRLVVEEVGG
ncbi:MAG: hypothetical protein D6728_10990 [Cyanobacteria bacterium J055]|nr:MAG: hypothetical protein D6728_10990 [Cyanobacteria bacterium J055]